MESLRLYTPLNITPNEDRTLPDEVIERLLTNEHNVMYNRLDTLLLNLIGEELTFVEILDYLKMSDSLAYQKLSCIALD